jgi:hypothetical protein
MTKRTGRPPLDPGDPSVRLCVRLPATRYDALYARARAARVSVPELVRRALQPRVVPSKVPARKPSR